MQTLWQDLRHGARMLLKYPIVSLVVTLSIGLGVGANTMVYTWMESLLLNPYPGFADADRLVGLNTRNADGSASGAPPLSYPETQDWRERALSFDGLAVYRPTRLSLRSEAEARGEPVWSEYVSGSYFDVLGVRPALERTFLANEEREAAPVAVISHGFWQRRFQGDPVIAGRRVQLNGLSATIVGVAPPGFGGVHVGVAWDLWLPVSLQAQVERAPDRTRNRGDRWLQGFARLKPGVTVAQADAELNALNLQISTANGETPAVGATARLLRQQFLGSLLTPLFAALLAVTGLVLLVACANVANLLLVRASARRKEIAIRLALGAGRFRLVRQLLTESVLLAVLGGALGMLLAVWGVEVLKAAPPPPGVLPMTPDFAFDGRVLGFTLALSLLTGLVFGLAPAWQSTRTDLVAALKDEVRTFDQKRRRGNFRNALVVAQVALSLLLLIGAGLFLRSLWRAQAIAPGFDATQVLTAPLNINLLRYTREQGRQFYQQAVERVAALPGVQAVSLTRILPLGGNASVRGLLIEGRTGVRGDSRSEGQGAVANSPDALSVSVIAQNFFPTMGIALRTGRDFSATNTADSPFVIIVNETFAARHFPNEEALGKRLSLNGERGPWRTIIGIARDSKYATLGEAATPYGYLPLAQNHETGMTLLIRTNGNPAVLTTQVRQTVQSLEANLPLANVRPLTEVLGNSLYAARMGAALVGVFGLLALLLAVVGLYGVMSFVVARRTREIGIRMALGARGTDAVRLLLREGMTLVLLGCALGLTSAWLLARLLAGFLYDLSATDPLTFGGVALLLASVAMIACWIPARRATKVDPMIALRCD